MKLEEFLIDEEGNDSRKLPDGRFASTWDRLGRVWNIGPGLTKGITRNTIWTQEQLAAAEAKEFADTRANVQKLVKVKLTENQMTALESLNYNIGDGGFAHSTVLRDVNAGKLAAACQAFLMWDHAGGGVCKGLIKRRNDEIRLFNHPDDAPAPADLKTSMLVPPAQCAPDAVTEAKKQKTKFPPIQAIAPDPAHIRTASKLIRALYAFDGETPVVFDHIIEGPFKIHIGLKQVEAVWYVIFRGSSDWQDWVHNLEAFPIPVDGIGLVNFGNHLGVPDVRAQIYAIVGDAPFVLAGHSRGAGQAAAFACYAARDGKKAAALVPLGIPRTGDSEFWYGLEGIPITAFRTRDGDEADPVTEQPLEFLDDYIDPPAFADLAIAPAANDPWPDIPELGNLALHHCQLYDDAIQALYAPADHSKMRLGRRSARRDERTPLFASYAKALPPAPAAVNWAPSIASFGMMGNDALGDCTAAAAAHAVQTWTFAAKNAEVTLPDSGVISFYSSTTGYRPGDPSTDQGGVEADVLAWWHKNTLSGHSLDAFAAVNPQDAGEVKNAIALMGGVYLGVALPVSAQTQSIWDVPAGGTSGDGAPGSWGGHAIWAFAYDASHVYCITWGQVKAMTWKFFSAYMEEAWALYSKDWIAATGKAPSGFDAQALLADMSAFQNPQVSLPAPAKPASKGWPAMPASIGTWLLDLFESPQVQSAFRQLITALGAAVLTQIDAPHAPAVALMAGAGLGYARVQSMLVHRKRA